MSGIIINSYVFGAAYPGVTFDGTNDYMLRGAALTGSVDSKSGTFSTWFKINGGDGTQMVFLANSSLALAGIVIYRRTGNQIEVLAQNSAGGALFATYRSTTQYTTSATWHHLLISWKTDGGTSGLYMYIDNVNVRAGIPTVNNDFIDYTKANFSIGAGTDGSDKLNADLAELYFNPGLFLDISVSANRALFINQSTLKPVNLGPTGALPTGSQPILYLKGPASSFNSNLGTGGDFSVTGTLTDSSTSPGD